MGKSKEPIRLRKRKMATGNISLYLDIYIDGQRTYEYLKLYLVPEKTKADKEKNRETLQLAEAIRAKRIVELQNNRFGFRPLGGEKIKFFDFFQAQADRRKKDGSVSNHEGWVTTLRHLKAYERNRSITLTQIDKSWIEGFKDYLDNDAKTYVFDNRKRKEDPKPLAVNSKAGYFRKLRACMNAALRMGLISVSPFAGVTDYRSIDGTRNYLTIEELQQLISAECGCEIVRRAFLFSCLTGLRRSDIHKLTWSEVHEQSGMVRLIFRQKKTGGQEYLDISEQAASLMGERGKPTDKVFDNFLTETACNTHIRLWAARAGIEKHLSFHCARHTFAVMQLDLGTDLYTVSKLLGHREIKTTQIYAKVLDKNKQAAMNRIPLFDFDGNGRPKDNPSLSIGQNDAPHGENNPDDSDGMADPGQDMED